jgi:hypothetical protein
LEQFLKIDQSHFLPNSHPQCSYQSCVTHAVDNESFNKVRNRKSMDKKFGPEKLFKNSYLED